MSSQDSQRYRADERRRQLKSAVIAFNGRHSTLPCSLRDISESGARLQVTSTQVPDTFELLVDLDGLEVPCAVVWRRGEYVGVKFTAPPVRSAPKRTQVVQALTPKPQPTLRRKPVGSP